MPQIGWFEILVIVVLAILIIGPKDFPIIIKKIGNWVGSTKRYFSDIQNKVQIHTTRDDSGDFNTTRARAFAPIGDAPVVLIVKTPVPGS